MKSEYRLWYDHLKGYQNSLKKIKSLEKEINKLVREREKAPTIKTKVRSSMYEFPYVETHVTVDADDPIYLENKNRLIRMKQQAIEECNATIIEVEAYINGIPDYLTREVFKLVFIEGMNQSEASRQLHYSKDRAGQLIRAEFRRHNKD